MQRTACIIVEQNSIINLINQLCMKKTYYLPLTETVPFGAMERIMDATVISADPVIQEPDPDDPGALMM